MKTFVVSLSIICMVLLQACKSEPTNEEKAQALISEIAKQFPIHPESYNSLFLELDTIQYGAVYDSDCYEKMNGILKLLRKAENKDHFNTIEYIEYIHKNEKEKQAELVMINETIRELIDEIRNCNKELIGENIRAWRAYNKFTILNDENLSETHDFLFFINKDFTIGWGNDKKYCEGMMKKIAVVLDTDDIEEIKYRLKKIALTEEE